jgi:hypothetical protein
LLLLGHSYEYSEGIAITTRQAISSAKKLFSSNHMVIESTSFSQSSDALKRASLALCTSQLHSYLSFVQVISMRKG